MPFPESKASLKLMSDCLTHLNVEGDPVKLYIPAISYIITCEGHLYPSERTKCELNGRHMELNMMAVKRGGRSGDVAMDGET